MSPAKVIKYNRENSFLCFSNLNVVK